MSNFNNASGYGLNDFMDFGATLIAITNDGSLISSTNYWDTQHAKQGLFFMSGNAGAWRLLVPDVHKHVLDDMATGKYVEIELGRCGQHPTVTIWFEDGTPMPFQLRIAADAMDRQIVRSNRKQRLLIYTKEGLQQKHTIRRVM